MLISPIEQFREKLTLADDAFDGVAILVLPENLSDPVEEFHDTSDSIDLAKFLKSQGVDCKTAFDLGLKPKVLDRRGIDLWLGVVWFMENGVAPMLVGALLQWLATRSQNNKSETDVHFELRLQDGDKMAKMKFDGPMSSLEKLLSGLKDQEVLANDNHDGS